VSRQIRREAPIIRERSGQRRVRRGRGRDERAYC